MKRVVALAVLISFIAVPVAQAEERRFTPRMSVSFSPVAPPHAAGLTATSPARPFVHAGASRLTSKASIESAIAAAAINTKSAAVRRRNVLKKAWFWLVVGGAAAALVIVAASSSGDGGIY